jgi:hypothetical protein
MESALAHVLIKRKQCKRRTAAFAVKIQNAVRTVQRRVSHVNAGVADIFKKPGKTGNVSIRENPRLIGGGAPQPGINRAETPEKYRITVS